MSDEPILIALDPISGERIPDLISEEMRPRLTEMIWRAVADDR